MVAAVIPIRRSSGGQVALEPAGLTAVLQSAIRAPSMLNSQPVRVGLLASDRLGVLVEEARCQPRLDPSEWNLWISVGAFIEGLSLALGGIGIRLGAPRPWRGVAPSGFRPLFELPLAPGGAPDPLLAVVGARSTYRGVFAPTEPAQVGSLSAWLDTQELVSWQDLPSILRLVARYDGEEKRRTLESSDRRAELLRWLRLGGPHPEFYRDGLNREALDFGPWRARLVQLALSSGRLEPLARLGGLGCLLARGRGVDGLVVFHGANDEPEDGVSLGRRVYRVWLELTRRGLAARPMSSSISSPTVRAGLEARLAALGNDEPVAFLLGVGVRPSSSGGPRQSPRLPTAELVLPLAQEAVPA